jgi:hypothetical protein
MPGDGTVPKGKLTFEGFAVNPIPQLCAEAIGDVVRINAGTMRSVTSGKTQPLLMHKGGGPGALGLQLDWRVYTSLEP